MSTALIQTAYAHKVLMCWRIMQIILGRFAVNFTYNGTIKWCRWNYHCWSATDAAELIRCYTRAATAQHQYHIKDRHLAPKSATLCVFCERTKRFWLISVSRNSITNSHQGGELKSYEHWSLSIQFISCNILHTTATTFFYTVLK